MPSFERHKTAYPGVYYIIGSMRPSGKPERIYYIVYRRDGKKHEEKAGRQFQDDMTPARAAQVKAAKIAGSRTPNTVKRQQAVNDSLTLSMLWLEFRAAKSYLKRINDVTYLWSRHIAPALGDRHPGSLTLRDFDKLRHEKQRYYSPQTVKHILSLAVRVVTFGADRGLCAPLPFRVEYPKFDNRVTENLTKDQVDTLFESADKYGNPQVIALLRLALYTGMRKMEILRLRWDEIDLQRGFITIKNPKGVVTEVLPLNALARDVIENIPRGESGYLLPNRKGRCRHRNAFAKALAVIRDDAGLPKSFRPVHGLRHVYASWMASSGKVPMHMIQKLLGHKSHRMTERYTHLRDEALRKAADVADEIFG